jgi:hypothetical protein
MSVTLTLPADVEEMLRAVAQQESIPMETVIVQSIQETTLLRRIFSYFPEQETKELRTLLKKQKSSFLTDTEKYQLDTILDTREKKNAERLNDLYLLSVLRHTSLRSVMQELNIKPYKMPQ